MCLRNSYYVIYLKLESDWCPFVLCILTPEVSLLARIEYILLLDLSFDSVLASFTMGVLLVLASALQMCC